MIEYDKIIVRLSFIKKPVTLIFLLAILFTFNGIRAQGLRITEAHLGYPTPTIPYYHFVMRLALPSPSIIDVDVSINGKELRLNDVYSTSDFKRMMIDKNEPFIIHRGPSAAALSEDTNVYKNPYIVGWLRWLPGHTYNITATVRMKKGATNSKNDMLVSATQALVESDRPVFDTSWKNYKSVILTETAGIKRVNTPVETLLDFYTDQSKNIRNDVRVFSIDPVTHQLAEVPSQIFNILEHLKVDKLAPLAKGAPKRTVPFWFPTVTARLAFLANVPANSSRVFLVFYNNKKAKAKEFNTDLQSQGTVQSGMQIENNLITIKLHPGSGVLNDMMLNSLPSNSLSHGVETNGAIQWNPDIYSPPTAWAHTSDWTSPHTSIMKGPVVTITRSWGKMPFYPKVDASVQNEFFAGKPYIVSSSTMRINETINLLALRNGEMVFRRDLLNRVAWFDAARDSIVHFDLTRVPTLTELRMSVNVPWVTFYNEETGIGVAGIQLDYDNSGIEYSPRLFNPDFYINVGPWVYWARNLSTSYLSDNTQLMIPAMSGTNYHEKWAYLLYKINKEDGAKTFAPIIELQKELTNPLGVRVVSEVDNRAAKQIIELISGGSSPWKKARGKKK
jgi:hypothetical protein